MISSLLHQAAHHQPEVVIPQRHRLRRVEERILRRNAGGGDGVHKCRAQRIVQRVGGVVQAIAELQIDQRTQRDHQPRRHDRAEDPHLFPEPESEPHAAAQRYYLDCRKAQRGRPVEGPDRIHGCEASQQVGDDGTDSNGERHAERQPERSGAAAKIEKIAQPGDGVPRHQDEQG